MQFYSRLHLCRLGAYRLCLRGVRFQTSGNLAVRLRHICRRYYLRLRFFLLFLFFLRFNHRRCAYGFFFRFFFFRFIFCYNFFAVFFGRLCLSLFVYLRSTFISPPCKHIHTCKPKHCGQYTYRSYFILVSPKKSTSSSHIITIHSHICCLLTIVCAYFEVLFNHTA